MILPSPLCDKHIFVVEPCEHNTRLDRFIAKRLSALSRTSIQKIIDGGSVALDHEREIRPGKLVLSGQTIVVSPPPPTERIAVSLNQATAFFAQALVATHEHFFVLNKPAGLVTHPPAPASKEIALSDYVIAYEPSLKEVGEPGRPGIIHRLDALTSGVLLVARTQHGYSVLKELFSKRLIKKTYYAIVAGSPPDKALITDPLMRDPLDPRRMVCSLSAGAPAQTAIETLERTQDCALIKAMPFTGRTHQIRVHCAYHGYPIQGDSMYGSTEQPLTRYALHAAELSFIFEEQKCSFCTPLPHELALYWNSCKLKNSSHKRSCS